MGTNVGTDNVRRVAVPSMPNRKENSIAEHAPRNGTHDANPGKLGKGVLAVSTIPLMKLMHYSVTEPIHQ